MSLVAEETPAAERRGYRRFCFGSQVGPRAADMFPRVTGDIVDCEPA
jgi:hypothetical protein